MTLQTPELNQEIIYTAPTDEELANWVNGLSTPDPAPKVEDGTQELPRPDSSAATAPLPVVDYPSQESEAPPRQNALRKIAGALLGLFTRDKIRTNQEPETPPRPENTEITWQRVNPHTQEVLATTSRPYHHDDSSLFSRTGNPKLQKYMGWNCGIRNAVQDEAPSTTNQSGHFTRTVPRRAPRKHSDTLELPKVKFDVATAPKQAKPAVAPDFDPVPWRVAIEPDPEIRSDSQVYPQEPKLPEITFYNKNVARERVKTAPYIGRAAVPTPKLVLTPREVYRKNRLITDTRRKFGAARINLKLEQLTDPKLYGRTS